MSLLEKIDGSEAFGLFPGESKMMERLQHFGYQIINAEEDGLLLKAGEAAPVHEFHYSAADEEGKDLLIQKPGGRGKRRTAYHGKNIYAGYPQFHLSGNSKLRENFLHALKEATPWQG